MFTSLASFGEMAPFLFVNMNPCRCGMFSIFNYVAGALYEYDNHPAAGIEVNFEDLGLYYEEQYGPNWWNYYCDPIRLGSKENAEIQRFNRDDQVTKTLFTEHELSRSQVFHLIDKYIRVKEEIQKKVDDFYHTFFHGTYVISVHYRGTDKIHEAHNISHEKVIDFIRCFIEESALQEYRIFIASDEEAFVNQMQSAFPGVCLFTNSQRSRNGKPIHFRSSNNRELGEEALIDCLLLSRGNVLIRTSSNLSLWSTYFNPSLPVIELSFRYGS